MEKLIDSLSPGIYNFEDFLDDDGFAIHLSRCL